MQKIWIIAAYKKESIDEINRVAFDYIRAVVDVGWVPYIIPCNIENIDPYIQDMDGFILPGWGDIDPILYSEKMDGSEPFSLKNDLFSLKYISRLIEKRCKILGICRGMQLLNVYTWGTLIQHIQNSEKHNQYEKQYEYVDTITIHPWSFLHQVFGGATLSINSLHHQAVRTLGSWFSVVAESVSDGVIEAIEHESLPLYGVQWHPESLIEQRQLFQWFIEK